ncbi:MAG: hypothetical protein EOP85_20695 [Verrucomicrobiaceae bacterium]|nr:MAG: hypothetical protein EOP85_20695 [Verrucomicrobiaceae bacterium]
MSLDVGMWDSPRLGAHPLDAQGVVRICLSDAASTALEALGPHVLIVATKADATAPENMKGRMVLHCLPCSPERLDDAYRAARGEKPKARIKSKG